MYFNLSCKQLCFQQKKSINNRNKSTKTHKFLCRCYKTVILFTKNRLLHFPKYYKPLKLKSFLEIAEFFSFFKDGSSEEENKTSSYQEENSRGSSREEPGIKTIFLGTQEVYFIQVSDKIVGGVTKNLSVEFSKTKSRVWGALSSLDVFLLNPQACVYFGPDPET